MSDKPTDKTSSPPPDAAARVERGLGRDGAHYEPDKDQIARVAYGDKPAGPLASDEHSRDDVETPPQPTTPVQDVRVSPPSSGAWEALPEDSAAPEADEP